MLFGEKLKQLRTAANLSQKEVADKLGVTSRTYQNYEGCKMYPKNTGIYQKFAELFDVGVEYLLSEEDQYIIDASVKGGSRGKKDVQALVAEVGGLFAGGELSDDDKDKVMKAINDLYWKAKTNNKKYAPLKYRKAQGK